MFPNHMDLKTMSPVAVTYDLILENHLLEFNGQILPQNLAATKSSIRNNKILDKRRDNKEPANSKNKFPPTV